MEEAAVVTAETAIVSAVDMDLVLGVMEEDMAIAIVFLDLEVMAATGASVYLT